MIPEALHRAAETLAIKNDLGRLSRIETLSGGANNKVFRLICDRRPAILKSYFRDLGDKRDRLEAEYAFVNFARAHGLDCVAEPLGCDSAAGIAIYSVLPGRTMHEGDVTTATVNQALDFLLCLNANRAAADATRLGTGSEACFSVDDHIATVEHRLKRLTRIPGDDALDRDARRFVAGNLVPLWHRVSQRVIEGFLKSGLDPAQVLQTAERCLSPSDFGFHNALLDEDGTVYFIDFEYAGWDDPAKVVGDFFNQVALPVPATHRAAFTAAVTGLSPAPEITRARIDLLMPVYGCKWICIILNEFLPTDARRRRFAFGATPAQTEARRQAQLDKARSKLAALAEGFA